MTDNIKMIDGNYYKKVKALGLPEVKENNPWLLLHIKGDGIRAPLSWNAKIYKNKAGELKLVTTDTKLLDKLLGSTAATHPGTENTPERIISIDDSGWGCPVLGVLIGAHDSLTNEVITEEIKVVYFQSPYFETKLYLQQAAIVTMHLLDKLKADPKTCVIKICTGYIHTESVNMLVANGYTVTRDPIGDPLQTELEDNHASYVNHTCGADLYYDPKVMNPGDIGRKFQQTIDWIEKNNKWHLAKTGWKYFKNHQAFRRNSEEV